MHDKQPDPLQAAAGDAIAASARKALTPQAERALAEAEERRRLAQLQEEARPREINGRGGLDPVRYGDWEITQLLARALGYPMNYSHPSEIMDEIAALDVESAEILARVRELL